MKQQADEGAESQTQGNDQHNLWMHLSLGHRAVSLERLPGPKDGTRSTTFLVCDARLSHSNHRWTRKQQVQATRWDPTQTGQIDLGKMAATLDCTSLTLVLWSVANAGRKRIPWVKTRQQTKPYLRKTVPLAIL